MDTITAITPLAQAGASAGRAVVKVEGRSAATLSVRSIEQLGLAVGQEWDAALAERVHQTVAFEKALNDAARRIARRALSQAEVRARLEQGGTRRPSSSGRWCACASWGWWTMRRWGGP
jgi:hypothetical protein